MWCWLRLCSHLPSFLTRKSWQERFFNEKQSWPRLLQIAAESGFCCHSNSCNSSLALCAAQTSRKSKKLALALAFEVNGKEKVDSQRRIIYHTAPCAPKLERSVYLPAPSPYFFLVMETTDLATRLSLVSCQKGAWRRAFFSEKLNFFQLEKNAQSCRKRCWRWRFKKRSGLFWKHSIGL